MKKIQSKVQIHFEGDITENHQLPVRTLGKCLVHIQNAFDRAHLDLKYENGVYKYARMTTEDYIANELWVDAPQEGGYIANLFSRKKETKDTSDRVSNAINQVIDESVDITPSLRSQLDSRKVQLENNLIDPIDFKKFSNIDDPAIIRQYGDRSISKEIDEVLTIVRSDYAGTSTLQISITGSSTKIFDFDKSKSVKFHKAVTKKSIGKAVIYRGTLQSLDKKNLTGKFLNSENNRASLLRITDKNDFLKVHPFLGDIGEIVFLGCPIIEFGALDLNSGDIYFAALYSDYKNSPGNIKVQ